MALWCPISGRRKTGSKYRKHPQTGCFSHWWKTVCQSVWTFVALKVSKHKATVGC